MYVVHIMYMPLFVFIEHDYIFAILFSRTLKENERQKKVKMKKMYICLERESKVKVSFSRA